MRIDAKRLAASALEAALTKEPEPEPQPHRLRGVGAVAAGAALVTGARLGLKHLSRMTELRLVGRGLAQTENLADLRNLMGSVREKVADSDHDDDGAGELEDHVQQYGGDGSEDYASEPDEEDEDWPSDEQNGDGNAPDLIAALNTENLRPPVMERLAEGLDPAARPPEAVERRTGGRRRQSRSGARSGSQRKTRSTAG